MSNIKILLLIVGTLFLFSCKTSQPIYNVAEKNPVAQSISKEQVRQAIIDAATFKRWHVKESTPDMLVLAINVRQHYAEIEVPYTDSSYSISYRESTNLGFEDNNIHRNYNKWIKLLEIQIDRELALIR